VKKKKKKKTRADNNDGVIDEQSDDTIAIRAIIDCDAGEWWGRSVCIGD
jgi:hypothetical protein